MYALGIAYSGISFKVGATLLLRDPEGLGLTSPEGAYEVIQISQ